MQNHCATNIQFPEVTKELRLILEDPTVNELNGEAFERLLKIEFEKQGFTVRNTPVSGDYGVDLILSTPASFTSIAVQVKRSSSSVGVNAVQEVVGGMAHYNCTKGMVITNAKFTKQAHALAASNSIHLIHVASAISVKRNETNDQFNETHYECPNEWRLERNGNNGQFNAKGQYGAGVDALADVDMSPYVSTVQRRINQNWLPSQELSSLTSEYTLVISRTGALLNYRLKRSSGNALFEELATSAITATNFPPLPTGYRGEYITIDFYFDYEACP
jgi:restriction system protein